MSTLSIAEVNIHMWQLKFLWNYLIHKVYVNMAGKENKSEASGSL